MYYFVAFVFNRIEVEQRRKIAMKRRDFVIKISKENLKIYAFANNAVIKNDVYNAFTLVILNPVFGTWSFILLNDFPISVQCTSRSVF